jgi:ABC-type ATPase involved in cell division
MTADIMRIFTDLHQKGTTILFATHDADLARRYPHRVIRIAEGKMAEGEIRNEVKTAG